MPTHTTLDDQLGCELYDLMQEPYGATPAAIQAKAGLMSLAYIRDEAPHLEDGEVQEEAVAVTARSFIEQATYALDEDISEREHTEADRGAAARCLLGLHPATVSMNLADRRKRAAEYLVKKVRTMTKPRKDRGGESHEMRLMKNLALQLQEREFDFLRGQGGVSSDRNETDRHWFAAAHNAWRTARALSMRLKLCSGFRRHEPDIEYDTQRDYISLEWFGKFWHYVKIPAENSPWFAKDREPETGRASLSLVTQLTANMFGRGLPEILFVSSPFDRQAIEKLSAEIVATPDANPPPIIRELITTWQAWLESCPCSESDPNPESCEFHWFYSSLEQYIDELHKCWDELRDPHHTPAHFGNDPSPTKIFERYGLRIPAIDKNT
jgi:hypothetical protein